MSGRKLVLPKYQIVSAGAMTGTSTVTSKIVNIQNYDNIGVQVNITSGTPSGTLDVTVSMDYNPVTGSGTFIPLPTASYRVTVTSGSPANSYFDLSGLSAPYVQLLWTNTSGTGTFDAFIAGKML